MKKLRIPIRIVFYRDEGLWIAHCLEFDLMGDGASKEEAQEHLAAAIVSQADAALHYDNPVNLFKPADGKFFAMFAAGTDVAIGELHLDLESITIGESKTREYVPSPGNDLLVCA